MNSAGLVEEIKKELKKRGMTYAHLGESVGLSEAAVKRAFALRNFSLRRLDQICEAVGIDFAELVMAARRNEEPNEQMSTEVEEALAADPTLLLTLYLILLKRKPTSIKSELGISKERLYRLTRELERLGLVDVLPGETVRPKIRKTVRWRDDGPLAERYGPRIMRVFFSSKFKGASEHQDFLTGVLTPESFKVLKRKLVELFRQFDELSDLDSRGNNERTEGFWFYCGIRPWAPLDVIREKKG